MPYATPTLEGTPVTFRQSATDAHNQVRTAVAAAFAQDQIELSRFVQLIGGLRFDLFNLRYQNHRTADELSRTDAAFSPRAGVIVKPVRSVSAYGSYTVSFLPASGDQFSSLTTVTAAGQPERLRNAEAGLKWDVRSDLSVTVAAYRVDRTNTRSTDPNDATRIVQTGSQRTNGIELGVSGRANRIWQVAGGYAHQHAFVTSATIAAPAGAEVAQVPRHTFSLWNTVYVHPRVGVGVGVVQRTAMFAAIDNTVTLPGYTDIDGAVYFTLTPQLRLQANIENVFDRRYYLNADNNTNISPGSPRAVRVGIVSRF